MSNFNSNVSSCYNCEKRYIGCHSNCETYEQYKIAKDVIKKKKEEYRILNIRRYYYARKYWWTIKRLFG